MNNQHHSITVDVARVEGTPVITVKVTGILGHADYAEIFRRVDVTMHELSAPVTLAFIDATELEGWKSLANLDNEKFGWKYAGHFTKIAILENRHWLERLSNIAHWFTAGQLRYFEDADAAWGWLLEP